MLKNITTTLKLYLLIVFTFTVFRVVLLLSSIEKLGDASAILLAESFLMGLRFDIVITSYMLILPYVLFSIDYLIPLTSSFLPKLNAILVKTFIFIAFAISATDIPYFNQFYSRLSITALEWLDSPKFVFQMILGEPKYFVYILLFIVLVFVTFFLITKIVNNYKTESRKYHFWIAPVASVLFLGFIILVIFAI